MRSSPISASSGAQIFTDLEGLAAALVMQPRFIGRRVTVLTSTGGAVPNDAAA